MTLEERIESIISPALKEEGYGIVRIQISGGMNSKRLQIMIENISSEEQINVDDCAKVSRISSVYLDNDDPIEENYVLEVSSPGIDRPLTKPEHFIRFCGKRVKIQTFSLIDERKRFKGLLLDANNKEIKVQVDSDNSEELEVTISYDDIKSAKLIS